MNKFKFYGCHNCDITTECSEYPGITTVQSLYEALLHLWCAETCAPRMRDRWTADNPTMGQCSITAFLAQDIFGGEVRGVLRPDGNYHCYNVVGDCVFDLTSEQFGNEKLDYTDNPLQSRESHFAKTEKFERYKYLKESLRKYCFL